MRRKWVITASIAVLACSTLLYLLLSTAHHDAKTPRATNHQTNQHKPSSKPSTVSNVLATYTAPHSDRLVTNEFAHFNAGNTHAVKSPDWDMTSGSLFARGGVFWTGKPDTCQGGPNATSTNCTNSDVFRLNTAKSFSGDIKLSLSLKQNTDIHNGSCGSNDTCWHGTHVWLRYQNQFNLYYVSLNRADGQVVIKRKVPCGDSDQGTYFVLGNYVQHDFKPGVWNNYVVAIQTNADGSVTINLYDAATSTTTPVVSGTDQGGVNPAWSSSCTTPGHYSSAAYAPITASGSVGIRGDYANFEFTDVQISKL